MLANAALLCMLVMPPPEALDLLVLDRASAGAWMPAGWTQRAVRGFRAPEAAVMDSGGTRFLRFSGASRAGFTVRELSTAESRAGTRLSWSFRVRAAPPAADLAQAGADDSPLRVLVVFDNRRSPFARPRTLFYSISAATAPAYSQSSRLSRDMHVIGMPRTDGSASWQLADVDPIADYQRIWGAGRVRVAAIGLMQDTDQTGGNAIADLRHLTWSTTDAPHP